MSRTARRAAVGGALGALLLTSCAAEGGSGSSEAVSVVAAAYPFAYVVDAERAAFQGAVVSGTVGLGLAVAVGFAALTVAWGVRTFHRESA